MVVGRIKKHFWKKYLNKVTHERKKYKRKEREKRKSY